MNHEPGDLPGWNEKPFAGEVSADLLSTAPNPAGSRGFFVDGAKMTQGLVQVYTGNGKGKTTAAVGLAVRALGQGLRVLLVRFLKPVEPPSGEISFLEGTPGLEILTSGIGIICAAPDREKVAASVEAAFRMARSRVLGGEFDLVILDEINNALHRGYIPLTDVLGLMEERPGGVELVFTGRNAPEALLERADLVTVMEAVKHPMRKGIPARKGIEF
jgi:cob(I)alamin adenosyltransferase